MTLRDLAGEEAKVITVASLPELRARLDDFSQRQPSVVELVSQSGKRLQLGLGGPLAFAQFIEDHGKPPYLCAKAESNCASSEIDFTMAGASTPIPREYCIPVGEAIGIAEFFFLKSGPSPAIEWDEI